MIGDKVLEFTSVDSTNIKASELLASKSVEEGTLIVASFQEKGKGQEGNFWESEAGKNLIFSIILNPTFLKPEKQFVLNKIISLGVAEFIQQILPKSQVKIKWPNDIYVGDQKIAGILINNIIQGNSIENAIVGIGVNVNQNVFLSNAPNPVSISQLAGKKFKLLDLRKQLIDALNFWYEALKNDRLDLIDPKYISLLYRFGEVFNFRIANKNVIAKITGISTYGHLLLESDKAEKFQCDLKEVAFVI
jgi:BirA family transcriptional regulator, biotin operon repressor / biotin---[acetyl-CoA-carboxylase] ligase